MTITIMENEATNSFIPADFCAYSYNDSQFKRNWMKSFATLEFNATWIMSLGHIERLQKT